MEGKKLDKPTTMHIYWKDKMDFFGAEKLIYYYGGVQGYQEDSRLKCEWMQVLLDRPVYLNQDRKPKKDPKKLKPGEKNDDNPNIDTVMCFYAPKDDAAPRPKVTQPVTAVQEEKEGDKVIKWQSIVGPDLVTINTPIEGGKFRKDMIVTIDRHDAGDRAPLATRTKGRLVRQAGAEERRPEEGRPPKRPIRRRSPIRST